MYVTGKHSRRSWANRRPEKLLLCRSLAVAAYIERDVEVVCRRVHAEVM
jgi:hypothetical protein